MTTRRAASSLQRILPRLDVKTATPEQRQTIDYLNRLVSDLQQVISDLSSPGTIRGGNLVITDCLLPGSTLGVGDVYVDGNGFLKLRQVGSPVSDSLTAKGVVSSVTLTII